MKEKCRGQFQIWLLSFILFCSPLSLAIFLLIPLSQSNQHFSRPGQPFWTHSTAQVRHMRRPTDLQDLLALVFWGWISVEWAVLPTRFIQCSDDFLNATEAQPCPFLASGSLCVLVFWACVRVAPSSCQDESHWVPKLSPRPRCHSLWSELRTSKVELILRIAPPQYKFGLLLSLHHLHLPEMPWHLLSYQKSTTLFSAIPQQAGWIIMGQPEALEFSFLSSLAISTWQRGHSYEDHHLFQQKHCSISTRSLKAYCWEVPYLLCANRLNLFFGSPSLEGARLTWFSLPFAWFQPPAILMKTSFWKKEQ